jgi:hypothetical protein
VIFDNAVELECFSNSLHLEWQTTLLPPDLAVPPVLPDPGGNLHTQAENDAVLEELQLILRCWRRRSI